jgi:hypothetical protein
MKLLYPILLTTFFIFNGCSAKKEPEICKVTIAEPSKQELLDARKKFKFRSDFGKKK